MSTRRRLLIATAGVALLGASPYKQSPSPLVIPQYGDNLSFSTVSPAQPQLYQAAPVPNTALSAPELAPTPGTRISPRFFNEKAFNGGQGYVPGSTIEGQHAQRQAPVPGLNLNMPLQ